MKKAFLLSFLAAIALADTASAQSPAEPTNSALANESSLQNERERERE